MPLAASSGEVELSKNAYSVIGIASFDEITGFLWATIVDQIDPIQSSISAKTPRILPRTL